MSALALLPVPAAGIVVVLRLLAQVDFKTDTPDSILAAVIALGTVIVAGLLFACRMLLRMIEARDTKIDAKDDRIEALQADAVAAQAAWVNRERQLGQEMFPVFQQVGKVLEAVQHGMAITVEQARGHPQVGQQVNVDAQTLQRLTDLLQSIEERGHA